MQALHKTSMRNGIVAAPSLPTWQARLLAGASVLAMLLLGALATSVMFSTPLQDGPRVLLGF